MILVGILVGSKKPLLMARKKMREAEDKLLEMEEKEDEEEVMEAEIVDDMAGEEVV